MKERYVDIAFFLLRVVAGLLFFQYGAMKLLGWFGGMPPGTQLTPTLTLAGYLELIGAPLIVFGLLTRPVAFILSGEMAFAYFIGHQPHGTFPIQNHGESAVFFCFVFLFMAAYGAGPWSLDTLVFKKKSVVV